MPLYKFNCIDCGEFDEFYRFEDIGKVRCKCGKRVKRIYTCATLITDTSFKGTGEYDKRLGCKVEGRKHWEQLLKQKGYCELDSHYMNNL